MRDSTANMGNSRMQGRDGSSAACSIESDHAFQGTGRLLAN